ncbi:MAG: SpoIIE family protein phosphatase [Bacteroidota bacterium]
MMRIKRKFLFPEMLALVAFSFLFVAFQNDDLSPRIREKIETNEELIQYYTNRQEFETAIAYLNQTGYLYWENGKEKQAAKYFMRAAEYYELIEDWENLRVIYSNVGLIYLDLEDLDGAETAFAKNLEIQRQIRNPRGISSGIVDLAYVKSLKNDQREAISLLEEALDIAQSNDYESVVPNIYKQLSENYNQIGNVAQSEEFERKYSDSRDFQSRQSIVGEMQQRQEQSQVEALRLKAEARARELEVQLDKMIFQEKQDSISLVVKSKEDSLTIARQRDSLQSINIQKLEADRQLQETEIERQRAVQNFQQLVIYSVLIGLVLVLILVIIMYRSNRARLKANIELETKNKQIQLTSEKLREAFVKIEDQNYRITQSISYAREIQRALFPPLENINHFIKDSFIFFKPVDMVSGDFYWFRDSGNFAEKKSTLVLQNHEGGFNGFSNNGSALEIQGEKFLVSAVDCTGHGVPGAFMSMIGYNLLDSITQTGTTHPDRILSKMHQGVRKILKQDEGTNQDGMDISLCVINPATKTLDFSGANNPLIYVQNDKVSVIKGDRFSIGGIQKEKHRTFASHRINFEQPTAFYILTDGFTDQFGGEKGRKFLLRNFQRLIQKIHAKPMVEQKMILEKEFAHWKGDEDQIDDVLVIGFKLS